jgi:ATP-dependent DNA helicase RecQ
VIDEARRALREHFGFEQFRPGQAEAVAAVTGPAAPRDVLVVMPTGAGKSLCYQLPALMREDLTVVVSPLVSLMQDQVEALERVAPGRAALVNAQQDAALNGVTVARAARGELKLLYVAPERFSSPAFVEQIREARVGLFVVDEAHCVSQWGHDFRPDYFRLGDAARWLGAGAIVASTATATTQVAGDIVARLGLRDPVRVSTGFDRPNLSFAVVRCGGAADKRRRLVAALSDPAARPAIVYAGTRAETERLAAELGRELGLEALAYHAGLRRDQRAAAHERFMAGEVAVVVATNAFGMGVDKADVRTVAHAGVPGSVEAFYQEAGRAGRDGAPARALLLAEARDKGLHVFFIQRAEVGDAAIASVAERLALRGADGRYDVGLDELGDEPDAVRAIVGHLARAGVLAPAPAPADRLRGRVVAPFDGRARAACRASAAEAQRARWRQYRSVWAFVEGAACRRTTILRHFGDTSAPAPEVACCDVCAPELVPAAPSSALRNHAHAPAGDLDGAILEVVDAASPPVGRTRAVEILRGGRSRVVARYAYDGLPGYGAYAHLSSADVLERVDGLLAEGRLVSTGGPYPKLEPARQSRAA